MREGTTPTPTPAAPAAFTAPWAFFFLVLPSGISSGFTSITLPFVLTAQAGFPVATAAAVVAVGVSANLWRFLWGPVADLTLTARRWYLIGLVASAATLALLGVMPLRQESVSLLSAVVFLSQVAGTLIVLPLGGLMARVVAEEAKGRASGWYQAGNLGGTGLGGGAGVWLASEFSNAVAAGVMAAAMLASAAALVLVSDVAPIAATESLRARLLAMWRDLLALVRAAIPLFTIVLVSSPIGAGGMNNLWSAVAPDWQAGANTVALVTGVLNGVVSAVGCVAGGWVADRVGRWWSYFGSGALLALVAIAMAMVPRTPATFIGGVLVYALFLGMAYAAFSAIVLFAIGRGVASTKYAMLASLGNVPVVYMTALNGWTHDRYGAAAMLWVEALAAMVCVALGLIVLRALKLRTLRARNIRLAQREFSA